MIDILTYIGKLSGKHKKILTETQVQTNAGHIDTEEAGGGRGRKGDDKAVGLLILRGRRNLVYLCGLRGQNGDEEEEKEEKRGGGGGRGAGLTPEV